MDYNTSNRLITYLTLLTGLSISAVAIYYSVIGLTAIFAAAFVPIVIMGVILEIGKLVATIWLKQNWTIAPISIRIYLILAIVVLMILTSMGIFGYLSKAHSDQSLVSGDVQSKIAIYDEKIRISRENIDANRAALKQLDAAVDQVIGRSTTEQGAERSVQIRRQQGPERQRLIREIEAEQKKISDLNEARAPIAAEVRKVEAEVGPIKYIAALIYDDTTDTNILEKAVRWVIIMIVVIFDPLAVVLLLASQISFQHLRRKEEPVLDLVLDQELDNTCIDTNKDGREAYLTKELTLPHTYKNISLPDQLDISKHKYLFKPWIDKVVGIKPVGHQVYRPKTDPIIETPVVPASTSTDLSSLINNEYVVIDGETMHISVAKERLRPRVALNRTISAYEYQNRAEQNNKDEPKNNSNNTA